MDMGSATAVSRCLRVSVDKIDLRSVLDMLSEFSLEQQLSIATHHLSVLGGHVCLRR